ncbi:MAG: hypothetical protein ACK4UX_10455 [Thiobacillus sp.]
MKTHWLSRASRSALPWITLLAAIGGARAEAQPDPGSLFYTPAQRALLEQARARNITQHPTGKTGEHAAEANAPLRYDGVVIRSDGRATHWVDGRPQTSPGSAAGLKPGQVRAEGRTYEPYQILRPAPATPSADKAAAAQPTPARRETAEPAP